MNPGKNNNQTVYRSRVIIHSMLWCTKNYDKTQKYSYHYRNSKAIKTNEVITYQVSSSTHPEKAMSGMWF